MRAKRIVLVGLGHAHLHVMEHAGRLRDAGCDVTLVDDGRFWYSSIASGLLGGSYEPADDVIEAAPLARGCGVALIRGRATGIDRAARLLRTDEGDVPYDLASFNTGSRVVPPFPIAEGVDAFAAKPIARLVELRERLRAGFGTRQRVVVIGGNHSGCELACNIAALARGAGAALDLTLVHDGDALVESEPKGARAKMRSVLEAYGVTIRRARVERVEPGAAWLGGERLPFDHLLVATGLAATPVVGALGLAASPRGLRVTPALHAPDDDRIFAVGDCADIRGEGVPEAGLPKVGVFGVRAAPILLENLARRAADEPLRRYRPQRVWFASQNLGDGTGLASWGPFWWRGRSALAIKRHIDRRFMARYRGLYG